jgi:hypothetical protein
MKIKGILFSSLFAIAVCIPISFAQTNNSTPAVPPPGTIHQRKVNQQKRIANGIKSGQLTPKEASKLEKKESNLNKETRNMRAQNGGKLTPAERAKVNKQQNKLSKDIYKDKHNAKTGY